MSDPKAGNKNLTSDVKAGANANTKGVFSQGSIWRHIIVMTLTSAVGLVAIMLVDFIDLLYIKSLGTQETAAAIGFSGNVLFYLTSINIGISIAAGVLIARALGRGDREHAKELSTDFYTLSFFSMIVVAVVLWIFTPQILTLLGATGETHRLATSYLRIMWWSAPVFVLGFCGMAILRSLGDARRSMTCTLYSALVNAVLDPFFIFDQPLTLLGIDAHIGLGWGIEGAAVASLIARFALAFIALHGVIIKHGMITTLNPKNTLSHVPLIGAIAFPAMLTNFATPVGDSFVTRAISNFGVDAVSAYAVIGRLIPIAFAVTFALSGAIGPIVSQNMGAARYDRVQQVLTKSLVFVLIYIASVSLFLLIAQDSVIQMFSAKGDEAELIRFFLTYISFGFTFFAAIFVSNAAFNNMGKPSRATLINFIRALGAVPFLILGGYWFGAKGVFVGQMFWNFIVAVVAIILAFRLLDRIAMGDEMFAGIRQRHTFWRVPLFSHGAIKALNTPQEK